MRVEKIYINTYKYDWEFCKVCIGSIRYWYPDIPIELIKDIASGDFSTASAEKNWDVTIFPTNRKNFGWGFGKWEPLFQEKKEHFLVLDADTVLTGTILDEVENLQTPFVVDEEIQSSERLKQIYYDVKRLKEVDERFEYPGYSFNEGQWFGTSNILKRGDFDCILEWTMPPTPKYPEIIYQGAQGHLNFILQLNHQLGKLNLTRKKIMIWPDGENADFIDLELIKNKENSFPFIIHWAGMRFNKFSELPRADIFLFYSNYYYTKFNIIQKFVDGVHFRFLQFQKKINRRLKFFKKRHFR